MTDLRISPCLRRACRSGRQALDARARFASSEKISELDFSRRSAGRHVGFVQNEGVSIVVATQQPSVAVLAAVNLAFVIGHLDLRGNNHPRPGFVPLTRLSAAGAFISPSPSWRGSDSIRVLLFLLILRSGRAILRYYPRLLSSWPTSSTDAPRLRSIAEAVASSFPFALSPSSTVSDRVALARAWIPFPSRVSRP